MKKYIQGEKINIPNKGEYFLNKKIRISNIDKKVDILDNINENSKL